jgi:membrane protein required for colicin V production
MNAFDLAVVVVLVVGVVLGYRSGLLRSLATIFGYLAAMPVAVAAAPWLSLVLIKQFDLPLTQTWWGVLCGSFVLSGIALGALLRRAVDIMVGPTVSLPDRMAGSALAAVRIGLLAVLMVVIFDRIIPPGRQPGFLEGSHLRPVLSVAGQQGLKSLPPDLAEFIDRLKRERGI